MLGGELRKPNITVTADDGDVICLKLAKAGYGGGNPETIEKMEVSWVIKMMEYEDFCYHYENELHELNKDNG